MFNLPMQITAQVQSINAQAEVSIIKKVGDNDYRAEYDGKTCTAIFNPFTCLFYVDDVYGVIKES